MSEKVKAVFDEWASRGKDREMAEGHKFAVREALRDIEVKPDAMVLDIGCGNGYVTRALARRLPKSTVMGIDFSEEMILNARDETPEAMLNAVFYEGLITDEVLDDERFDLVVAVESLYYMQPMVGTLFRLRSMMNPGAQMVCIVDYYAENAASHGWPEQYGLEMELKSAEDYKQAFENAGFVNVSQRYITQPETAGKEDWKASQGSLVTYASVPSDDPVEAIFN